MTDWGRTRTAFLPPSFLEAGFCSSPCSSLQPQTAGAIVIALNVIPNQMIASGGYIFGRALITRIMNVYALKMAAVFMISCATLATRTRILPRVITLPGYALAVLLMVSNHFVDLLALAFPLWVLVLSVYMLIENLRTPRPGGGTNPMRENY